MDLESDMWNVRYLTAQEGPELLREKLGLVIFSKIMAEALQKYEISNRHLKFNKYTTKFLCSIKLTVFQQRVLRHTNKYLKHFLPQCTSLCCKSIHLSNCGHNAYFVMVTLCVIRHH